MIIRPDDLGFNRGLHSYGSSYMQYRSFMGSGTYGGARNFGTVFGATTCPAGTTLKTGKCCVSQADWDGKDKRCVLLSANPVVITSPNGKKHVKAGGGGGTQPPPDQDDDNQPPPAAPQSPSGGGGGGGGYFSSDTGGGSALSDLPWIPIAIGAGILVIAIVALKGGKKANGGGGTTVIAA